MMLKNICFSFAVLMAFSSSLLADKDLVIAYEVPRGMKKKLYNEIIENTIPGPHHYHVTLFHVKNVDEKDYAALRNRLQPIKRNRYSSSHFTPDSAIELNQGYLVFVPKEAEKRKFALSNSLIYQEFQRFNFEHGTSYQSSFHTLPTNYTPHITIAAPDDIQKKRINVDNALLDINLNLAGYHNQNKGVFEVLHGGRPPSPRSKMNRGVVSKKPTARSRFYKQNVMNSNQSTATKKSQVVPVQMKQTPQSHKPKAKIKQAAIVKSSSSVNPKPPSLNQKKIWQPTQQKN